MACPRPTKSPVTEDGEAADGAGNSTKWTPQVRKKFESKNNSVFLDPCQEVAAKSIRCLHRNGGDRAMCQDFFQAYRDCKKEWTDRRLEEKKKAGEGRGWFS